MKDFKQVLKEVNVILDEVLLFDVILNSVLIFLGTYLVLMILNLNPWYSLLITLAYFVALLYRDIKKSKYKMVENAYEPLYESLRTAADNADAENEVVEELKQEVVSNLRHVPVSSFVKTPRITGKILASVLLCFTILLAAIYNIAIPEFGLDIPKSFTELVLGSGEGSGDAEGTGVNKGGGAEDELYGEDGVAELGDEELTMTIKKSNVESIGLLVQDPPIREFEETFPDEVFATSSGSFEEKISLENQQLVKKYFKELSKG